MAAVDGRQDDARRVLIVDDYPMSRAVWNIVLGTRGHVCMAVGGADAALSSIATFEPHVVLLEWALRDGSGSGLAAHLRARSRACGREIVIIVMSVWDEPDRFREREAVDLYLTKPVRVEDVEAGVRMAPSGRYRD